MSRLWFVLAAGLALTACDDTSRRIGRTRVTIESPLDDTTVFSQNAFKFSVTAANNLGISSIELRVGDVLAKTCPGAKQVEFGCELDVKPTDFSAQVKDGILGLKATAYDANGDLNEQVVGVAVKPIRISFVSPVASGSPPVATVSGTSLMQLDVESEVVIDHVQVSQVVNGGEIPLRRYTSGPYEDQMEWSTLLGGKGDKVIKAEVVDSENNTDTATLSLKVE